ncbi:chemotaxis protein CheD [Metabacillus iocasae]|uniref:Probable chemoreceptor glutamine deamidase CheD n=1 Tax=Priestia iocasae TaxID=2291674 RepID=A0ABS2QR15_9BACI|nr:chemotaxis protein CheD [Metabacillus iocasae]MBM7701889.1 chemotaxis protein CheD [Metabacillus iocasae]
MIHEVNVVKVGIADLNIVKAPDLIRTAGLGSCVGVIIYDLQHGIAGLAHIMLPDSSLAKNGAFNQAKYADTAVDLLIKKLMMNGANKFQMKAKLAGGAQMFQFHSTNDLMRIGPRNVEAVELQLKKQKIPIVSRDIGGQNGRTIEFNPKTGMLTIRTVNQGTSQI